jgi:hypothetical protein
MCSGSCLGSSGFSARERGFIEGSACGLASACYNASAKPQAAKNQQQPQQTGLLLMHRQQQQPALSIVVMHSQDAWIMSQHALSPEVQVMQTPVGIISHLHIPRVRLQVQTAMPFIIMQQLTIPPAIMLQRFCIMVQAALSSQVQVSFIPSLHFSIFMVQRGIMSHCAPVGMVIGMVAIPVPAIAGMFIPVRSIIMFDIEETPMVREV